MVSLSGNDAACGVAAAYRANGDKAESHIAHTTPPEVTFAGLLRLQVAIAWIGLLSSGANRAPVVLVCNLPEQVGFDALYNKRLRPRPQPCHSTIVHKAICEATFTAKVPQKPHQCWCFTSGMTAARK